MSKVFTMDDVPVLYEDNSVLVAVKPQNIPSQADASGDLDLLTLLKSYVKQKYGKPGEVYLGLVHRLDRPTGGVMVFARNSKSAARLSKQFAERETSKRYLAVVRSIPPEKQGKLIHYLKKNTLTNNVYLATVGTTGAKKAELSYKLLESADGNSLLDVELGTGRSHQIRVQFSAINCPVYGDVRYGGDAGIKSGSNLALWAYKLSFEHPVTKQRMLFLAYPPEIAPWNSFNVAKYLEVCLETDEARFEKSAHLTDFDNGGITASFFADRIDVGDFSIYNDTVRRLAFSAKGDDKYALQIDYVAPDGTVKHAVITCTPEERAYFAAKVFPAMTDLPPATVKKFTSKQE